MKKNVLRGLEVNEKDNVFTAFAKGGTKGLIVSTLTSGAIIGTFALVGKLVNRNDEVEVFEEEFKAE